MSQNSTGNALEADDDLCKLKLSKKLKKRVPLFVTIFSNGRLNFNSSQTLKFQCYRSNDDNDVINAKRTLFANSGRLNYSGSSFGSDSERNGYLRYFVGVRNKASGKMTLYSCILFYMKPILKCNIQLPLSDPQKDYKESRDELTASFGSKIQKKALAARLKYSVRDASTADALEMVPMDTETSVDLPSKSSDGPASNSDYIPPLNRNASTVHEVFNVDDIITAEECEYLNAEAETLVEATTSDIEEWKSNNAYCSYVIHHINAVKMNPTKAKYLIYYNYLVIFHKLGYQDLRKKEPATQIPEPFRKKILDSFTVASTNENSRSAYSVPPRIKDKLLAYLMVLALLIDDYSVNTALVKSDLKAGIPKLVNISQALGCHITSHKVNDTVVKFIELKLPLVFPSKYTKKKY